MQVERAIVPERAIPNERVNNQNLTMLSFDHKYGSRLFVIVHQEIRGP